MSDFGLPYLAGDSSIVIGADTTITDGVNVTASTNNTKGSWVELESAVPEDLQGIFFNFAVNSTDDNVLIDIGVGSAGSEEVIVSNLRSLRGDDYHTRQIYLPVRIEKGSRVVARIQTDDLFNGSVWCAGVGVASKSFEMVSSFNVTESIGANTSNSRGTAVDPGGTSDVKGSWVELEASIGSHIEALVIGLGLDGNTIASSAEFLIDIGIGSSGNEEVVISNVLVNAQTDETVRPSMLGPFPVDIPKGARVSARAQSSITDATDRVIDLALVGFGR